MNFATAAKKASTIKTTENGALAYNTSNQDALLDLFSQIGALRPRTDAEIANKFASAFMEDPKLATKMLFYAGNIRGGLGERRTFRICLNWLARNCPEIVIKNMDNIPFYNRYDSLFCLVGTDAESEMWKYIARTLIDDVKKVTESINTGKKPVISLLAKWMPSENASSKDTIAMARRAIHELDLTPRKYRKMLSILRKHLKVVEGLMSAGKWDEIYYPGVPSYAMKNYSHAFGRHDFERFNQYIRSLNKGEAKINASTLYPYDLVHKYMDSAGYWRNIEADPITEAQWKALPNYVGGNNNILVMADVSGSMYGRPMETSIGLATYFAQHNHGDFHNLYMTFTDHPKFISLKDNDNLANCVQKVMSTGVGYSTNLERAFDAILTLAVNHNISVNDMPKALVVVSDMEIDPYFRGCSNLDFVQAQERKFKACGYELPKLILWNVEARNDTFLSQSENVLLVSGQSTSTFRNLCGNLSGKTAYDLMLEVLNDPMYDRVVF